VTCAELPEGEDATILDAAFRPRGLEPVWAVWNDPAVDWDRFELVVVRSAWDWAERWREFLAWAEARARIENSHEVLRFGMDKERYLGALSAAGAPIVPTAFVHEGDPFDPPDEAFVVKPAISAGGRRSARFEAGDGTAGRLVGAITDGGAAAMVQPLLTGVPETSLVYVDGAFSHSLARRASLPSGRTESVLYLEEELGPHEAGTAERQVADAALAAVPGPWLYARVDLLGGLVLELEVVEPSLYLAYGEGSAARFATAVAARLRP
jgi:glutathione synthase/RimK-type ligase-like ATP-grasp enzyme